MLTGLNAVLADRGYTTAPAEFGAKRIVKDGSIVFAGTADAVWHWLRRRGEWSEPCPATGYCHECKLDDVASLVAEMCACGHTRGIHAENEANCWHCGCGSFSNAMEAK